MRIEKREGRRSGVVSLPAFPRLRLRLFGRMLLLVGLASLLPLAAVIGIASWSAYRLVEEDSFRYVEESGRRNAELIGEELKGRLGKLETMATLMREYRQFTPDSRRRILAAAVEAMAKSNPDLIAVWTQWEPGALGDDPAQADPAFRGYQGAFSATWYYQDGKCVQGRLLDEDWQMEYYLKPKARKAPTLIDPYYYSYTGRPEDRVLETTIAVPIIVNGEFKGLVGFDSSPEFYGRILSGIRVLRTGYAVLTVTNGRIIWHPTASRIGMFTGVDEGAEVQKSYLARMAEGKPFITERKANSVSGRISRIFFFPVESGIADTRWYLGSVAPESEIREAADRIAAILFALGGASILFVAFAVYRAARSLTSPIIALSAAAARVAAGDLTGRVAIVGNDEIAELAASFNAMSEVLERRVKKRTLELSEANQNLSASNRELAEALERLQLAQEQIVASEKLAVLGKLAANIAHELNTPLGAIHSSVGQLLTNGREFLATLPAFVASLGEREKVFFNKLAQRGLERADELSGAADRAARRAVVSRFAAMGLPNPESLADDLESLWALDLADEAAAVVADGRPDIVSVAARLAALFRAEAIIRSAADKAALTVSALTNYSRQEEAEAPEPFDLIRAIETLLVLYYNATKHSVRIVRRFECRDPALGSRERLDHVWVNLIDNALQAMRYEGTLEIATRRSGERIFVSFTDSGPGIPQEIKDSIFKPFFTTKKSGEGTGLGLDICRKIVEDYSGSISFESEPGRTVFTVSLPAAGLAEGKDGSR